MTPSVAHELLENTCIQNDGEREYTVTAKTTSETRMKKKVQQRLPGLVCKCTFNNFCDVDGWSWATSLQLKGLHAHSASAVAEGLGELGI